MRKLLSKLSFVLAISIFSAHSGAGQGYQIDVTIDQLEDAELYLGYYMDGKTYVADSARYLENGTYSFKGNESLDRGMYFIAKSTTLLFDLVVGEDQFFELQTTQEEFASSMEVVGDLDNQLFYENMNFNLEMRKLGAPFIEIVRDSTLSEVERMKAREEIDGINKRVLDYQDETITNHPESILATLFKSGKQVEIPEKLKSDQSESGRQKQFEYYRAHYWDFYDLGNPVMLRLPNTIYKKKVDDYLDNLTHPIPDSIKVAVDELAGMAKKDESTYQYLVWYLTIKYQTSQIMGMDGIFVHLVDTYFLTGELDYFANDQLKKNLKEKADQYRNSLIGMVAPNLVLQDLDEQPQALHDLTNKYSVIYFYDPDCGHCKKETPVLKEFYDNSTFDVGVYTVSADTSMVKMNDYIEEMGLQSWVNTNGTRTYGIRYLDVYDAYTTPTIYLLNENKEIIAKKIAASQLSEAIANYEKAELQKDKSD